MRNPVGLLRKLDDRSHFVALAPELSIGGGGPPSAMSPGDDGAELRWLGAEGLVTLTEATDADVRGRVVRAIDACIGDELPATFIYVFDDTWSIGESVRARASALVGHRYVNVEDAWAFRIEPGVGRGWPPHRGRSAPLLERAAPEILNVWIALSDAGAERSCIHFVPLDEDPHYPIDLERVDAPIERTRAVPVAAGTAVLWNANVLHWGGRCSARAVGPRYSCTFTLCREDSLARLGLRAVDPLALDFRARIELIAEQIVVYGDAQPDVSAEVRAWARIVSSLASRKER